MRFKSTLNDLGVGQFEYLYVLPILYAVEPALLRRFFDIGFAKDSYDDQEIFEKAAPVALGIDPTLSSALIAIATSNGWAEPVASKLSLRRACRQ